MSRLTFIYTVDLICNARYKHELSVHFTGFKLATSTHALSILDAISIILSSGDLCSKGYDV